MNYASAFAYLHSLDALPKLPFHPYVDERGVKVNGVGLKRIQALLNLAGHPEKGIDTINVTGTSGKGSVCKMLHCIYHAVGRKVGTFYSPAVTTYIEQIEINGKLIAPEIFGAYVQTVKTWVDKVAQGELGPPSSFEVLLLIALLYFRDEHCDTIILESGLGGTYDACNIADRQIAAFVTTVGLDHL